MLNEEKLGSERTKLGSECTKLGSELTNLGSERTFIVRSEPSFESIFWQLSLFKFHNNCTDICYSQFYIFQLKGYLEICFLKGIRLEKSKAWF